MLGFSSLSSLSRAFARAKNEEWLKFDYGAIELQLNPPEYSSLALLHSHVSHMP